MRSDRFMPSSARGGIYLAAGVLGLALTAGCITWFPENVVPPEAAFAPPPITQNNPVLIVCQDGNLVFETVADVIDDYFKIDREVPVRTSGEGPPIEGLIETYPRGGSTLLEPWNRDSVNFYQRLESTLQSIRRYAHVQVIPPQSGQEGFLVHVEVFKELEDVARPEDGPASRAPNLRNDNSLRRYIDPVGGQQPTVGWIPLGHDLALEQEIIAQIQARFGMALPPPGMILPPGNMPAAELVPVPSLAPQVGEPATASPPSVPPLAPPENY